MKRMLALFGLAMAGLSQAAWVELDSSLETGVRLLEETSQGLRLECTLAGFEQTGVKIDQDEFSMLRIPGEAWTLEAAAPELPLMARSVMIPATGSVEINVISLESQTFEMNVVPSKGNLTRDIDPASLPYSFGPAYQQNSWPSQEAWLRDPYILRDYRGQTVVFQPFMANPVNGTVEVASRMVVELSWTAEPGLNELPSRSEPDVVDESFARIYRERFLNYGSNSRYTPLEEGGHMLIICSDEFAADMQPFVEWKRQSGMSVDFVLESAVGTSSAAILAYVEDYYILPGLTYLLLVGDAEQLPSLSAAGGSSDPGYSFLAGADYYPDIFVGRFSGSTSAMIQTMVERCVEYERDPQLGASWYRQGIGIGSAEGSGIGDDGEADWQHQDNIRADLLGYTYTLVDQIYDPGATAAQVTAAVNAGRSFINYTGHGSVTAWSTTGFSSTNASALSNANMLPFIVDVACVNGQFAGTTCFAEAWMRATAGGEPAGAVGIYASTINQSWAPPMAAQDECTDLLVAEEKITFGGICFNGSMLMNDEYADYDMTRTWTIFTDPSLLLRTNTPAALSVSHAASILSTAGSFTVQTGAAGARVTLYHDGTIYGSAIADASGAAQISIADALPIGQDLTCTVLAYNYDCYQGLVSVIPPSGPYVSLSGQSLDGDGMLNPNESTALSLTIENLGVLAATNLSFTLATSNPGITAITGSPTLASLAAGASATLNGAFTLQTGALSEGEAVAFTLTVEDGSANSWESSFSLMVAAPSLSLGEITVVDGDNGRLDPGESASIDLQLENDGSQAIDLMNLVLSTADAYVSITANSDSFSNLAPGASTTASFQVSVDAAAPVGHVANFSLNGGGGNTAFNGAFALTIGLTLEDFETGNFNAMAWEMAGNANWTIDNTTSHDGSYSAKSGVITHNQTSTLQLTANVIQAGDISFWYSVSSEANYDYFRFYVDGSLITEAAGTVAWTQYTHALAAGEHTIAFTYYKDGSVSSGSDCAWVDEIIFPSLGAMPSPEIGLSADSFAFNAMPGQVDTRVLSITNSGNAPLDWSFSFVADAPAAGDRSMEGSSLSITESEFEAGTTLTLNVSLFNGSTDNEWAVGATLDFPAGVTVISASNLSGGSAGDLTWDGATGDGALVTWLDPDGGYGNVYPDETATGTVTVSVDAGFSTDMSLPWTIDGDVWGADPHTVSGTITLINAGEVTPPWLTASTSSGTLAAGANVDLDLTADALFLAEGSYTGTITITSNDSDEGSLSLPVTFLVGGPSPVSELRIIYLGDCNSRLEWDPVDGIDFYRVYSTNSLNGSWSVIAETTETFWLVPCGVGGAYLYQVSTVTLP
jgi:hypothetical protein